jgi:hypothetical protein
MLHDLKLPILLNIATCLLKTRELKKAVHICDDILREHPSHLPTL